MYVDACNHRYISANLVDDYYSTVPYVAMGTEFDPPTTTQPMTVNDF